MWIQLWIIFSINLMIYCLVCKSSENTEEVAQNLSEESHTYDSYI